MSLWFLGDVHGDFRYLHLALEQAKIPPTRLIFLGDVDIDEHPLHRYLAPFRQRWPSLKIAFIHGNHDADSHAHWACLHASGDATPLHNRVVTLGGVRVAGLGGVFQKRVWWPGESPKFQNKDEALSGGAWRSRDGQRPKSSYHAAIYPDEVAHLARQQADVLVLHEAPSCHPHGFDELDKLARSMGVKRVFHGHHHDDRTHDYCLRWAAMGFETYALGACGIRTINGEEILPPQPF